MNKTFFISRAGADAAWAQWIADWLTEASYSVILQDWDFKKGQDFIVEMDRAMRKSERTIVILSRHFEKALFTVPEWTNAIARDPTGHKSLLIPVRIDDILPEGIFKTRVFVDLFGLDKPAAKERLLQDIDLLYNKRPKDIPSFPGSITTRFEGSLPPIWRVPFDRNPVFTGRKEEILSIRKNFEATVAPPLVTTLIGMGGVGKTALAVEYAHAYSGIYKAVWWMNAERKESLVADLTNLADTLNLAKEEDSLEVKTKEALNWLSHHDQWLLILDGADNPVVSGLAIPKGGSGHVLITSRTRNWRRLASVIDVKAFDEGEGAELLSKRSGNGVDRSATKLVQLLGGLPLGIELAGAFMEQQGLETGEYLDRIRRRGKLPDDEKTLRPPDYNRTLNSIWAESFRVLQEQSPVAVELMKFSAFVSPTDIPRPALKRGAAYLSASLNKVVNDPDDLTDLLAKPRAFSLVSNSSDGYSLNRLVQAMIREKMDSTEQKYWSGMAVLLLEAVLPKQVTDLRLGSRVGQLISHGLEAAENGIAYASQILGSVKLLDRGVTYLADTGTADTEEITQKRAEALAQAEKLPEGPPAWLLNNQAVWLISLGRKKEAATLLERAIETTRKTEGAESPSLGSNLVNYGGLLKEEKQYEKAYTYLLRGLAILDKLPDWAEYNRAIGHGHLGEVIINMGGDVKAAAIHFKEAADGYARALGPGSLEEIHNRSYLASVRGENPNIVIQHILTPEIIKKEEGKLIGREDLWQEDAEKLLREAWKGESPGSAVELSSFLRRQEGREEEGFNVLVEGAQSGDPESLYWLAREMAERKGLAAEQLIRMSIDAGNAFSYYDLGLVLAQEETRLAEAELAFREALAAGFEIARNDLGILLLEWPGREVEGERLLDECGRYGQVRSWHNLAGYLRNIPGREQDTIDNFHRAARAGYIKDYGYLAYYLIEKNKLTEAVAVFREGLGAGLNDLEAHLNKLLEDHPELRTQKEKLS
jgi:tetratricopeptide (TPR) repeat protein